MLLLLISVYLLRVLAGPTTGMYCIWLIKSISLFDGRFHMPFLVIVIVSHTPGCLGPSPSLATHRNENMNQDAINNSRHWSVGCSENEPNGKYVPVICTFIPFSATHFKEEIGPIFDYFCIRQNCPARERERE